MLFVDFGQRHGTVAILMLLVGIAALGLAGCAAEPVLSKRPEPAAEPEGRPVANDSAGRTSESRSSTTKQRMATATAPRLADKVLVLKSDRKLLLLDNGEPFVTFEVALGREPVGPKRREGDGRTPEGLYHLDWRNPDSQYYRSIHVSYPAARDIRRARQAGVDPGDNIMIHGLPEEFAWMDEHHALKDWTEGCIAVTNAEMDVIWNRVPDGTPIEIRP